jgi:tetratricopeptide (TPR) repeat protein
LNPDRPPFDKCITASILPGAETAMRIPVLLISALALLASAALAADQKVSRDCRQSGDPDRKIEACSQLIGDPAMPAEIKMVALQSRGLARVDKGDSKGAAADFDEAIRLDPRAALTYMFRASLSQYAGDHDRAIADLDEAIRINPGFALFYYRRGISHFETNHYDRAIADFSSSHAPPAAIWLAPKSTNRRASTIAPSPTSANSSGSTRMVSPASCCAAIRTATRATSILPSPTTPRRSS